MKCLAMIFRCKIINFIGFYILVSVIGRTSGLECFACNYTSSTLTEDKCLADSTRKCNGNSVCIAATYEMSSHIGKTYTVMQSCFPNMANQECEHFIKAQRDVHAPALIKSDDCYACTTDLCNKDRLKPSNYGSHSSAGLTTVIISILSSYILKLSMA